MVDIENYVERLLVLLIRQYGKRLVYVGLQGSYYRGEANNASDIDIMAVIDGLCISDLDSYRSILSSLEASARPCGFICSKTDLANWNPLEACHLLNSTKDCYGVLKPLLPVYTQQDIQNFVKLSINNLYHEICHRYIYSGYEKSRLRLPDVYKSAFFILQNLYYLKHGEFIRTKMQLLTLLSGKDKAVLEHSISLNNAETYDFAESFTLLFTWCQDTLANL